MSMQLILSAQLRRLHFLKTCHRIVQLFPHNSFLITEVLPLRIVSTSSLLSDPKQKTGHAVSMASATWNCPTCFFQNFVNRRSCRRCGHKWAKNEVNTNAVWVCSGCDSINYVERTECHKCAMLKPKMAHSLRGEVAADGSWFCANCEFPNYPIRDTCFCCETMVTDKQRHEALKRSGIWECGICGNKNYPLRKECNACNTARSAATSP